MTSDRVKWVWWPTVVHSVRTAVVAVASLLAARLFRLPQMYWAPITTLVITQSSLGAALAVSGQRFVGTVGADFDLSSRHGFLLILLAVVCVDAGGVPHSITHSGSAG